MADKSFTKNHLKEVYHGLLYNYMQLKHLEQDNYGNLPAYARSIWNQVNSGYPTTSECFINRLSCIAQCLCIGRVSIDYGYKQIATRP